MAAPFDIDAALMALPHDTVADPGIRGRAFLANAPACIEAGTFWPMLQRARPEMNFVDPVALSAIMQSQRATWSDAHMEPANAAAFSRLPELVPVYRGQDRDAPIGPSFTLDPAVAMWFSAGATRPNNKPVVIAGVIPRSDIAGVFVERSEAEVLVFDPGLVQDLVIVDTPDDAVELARKYRLLDFLRVERGEEPFTLKESSAPPVFMLVQLHGGEETVYGFHACPGDYELDGAANNAAIDVIYEAEKHGVPALRDRLIVTQLTGARLDYVKRVVCALDEREAELLAQMTNHHSFIFSSQPRLFAAVGL